MNFPIGSLLVLLTFILITSGIIKLPEHRFRLLVYGLAAILLGSFLVVPLPAPKGLTLTLNTGHAIMPLLVALFVWTEAEVDDKYRASLGSMAVGFSIYGISALLDLEPGLISHPLLFTVPIAVLLALLTGKTKVASSLAIVIGCTLVSLLRFLEVVFTQDMVTTLEFPGSLVWNTLSLGTISSLSLMYLKELVESSYQGLIQARNNRQEEIVSSINNLEFENVSEQAVPQENELIKPEQ